MTHPQRIMSLWDMLSAIGEGISAISNVVHMLGQVGDAVKKIEPNDSIHLTEEYLTVAIRDLNCLKSIADDLNLDAASHSVDYCLTVLSRGYVHGDGSYTLPFNNAERLVTVLGGVDKFEPVSGAGDMYHAEEAFGELIISGGDGAVDFQAAEESFDVVSLPVERPVMLDLDAAV